MPRDKILVTPGGGQGSTKLIHYAWALRRPDTAFELPLETPENWILDIKRKPKPENAVSWERRTKQQLDLNKTIEQNLLDCFENEPKHWTVFAGLCSSVEPFFTKNGLMPICIARIPVDGYVSLLSHQHPKVAIPFGGHQTEECVRWYAQLWNTMIGDILASGCNVIRSENLYTDCKHQVLLRDIKGRWFTKRKNNEHELEPQWRELLMELVGENYERYCERARFWV
jgi:hypothetical protein